MITAKEPKEIIPSEFYNGDEERPYADSVGMLIKELQRLPPELPIKQGWGFGCTLTVYNISDDAFLEITENEDEDDDADDCYIEE